MMKKLLGVKLLLILILTIGIGQANELNKTLNKRNDPGVLERNSAETLLDSSKYIFENFEGEIKPRFKNASMVSASVIKNPVQSKGNSSTYVGVLKNVSNPLANTMELQQPLRFSNHSQLSLQVFSSQPKTSFSIKLKGKEKVIDLNAVVKQANVWETIVIDISSQPDVTYSTLAIYVNQINSNNQNLNFYFDNFAVSNGETLFKANIMVANNSTMLEDFEGELPYAMGFYAGAHIEDNPKIEGINTSSTILRIDRATDTRPTAGAYVDLDYFTLKKSDKLRFKVWSPKAGITMRIELENGDDAAEIFTDKTIPTAGEWITMEFEFDLIAQSIDYRYLSIFFDYGKEPETPREYINYYIDDFEVIPNTGSGNKQDNTFAGAHPEEVLDGPDPASSIRLIPGDYNILQGIVTDNQAFQNKQGLIQAMKDAKANGYNTFIIDDLDAYFNVSRSMDNLTAPWQKAVVIPEGMTLLMGENCHLRVQPNNESEYALLSNATHDNVTIKGGFLYGERNEHTYSGSGTDEHGHVIVFIALKTG